MWPHLLQLKSKWCCCRICSHSSYLEYHEPYTHCSATARSDGFPFTETFSVSLTLFHHHHSILLLLLYFILFHVHFCPVDCSQSWGGPRPCQPDYPPDTVRYTPCSHDSILWQLIVMSRCIGLDWSEGDGRGGEGRGKKRSEGFRKGMEGKEKEWRGGEGRRVMDRGGVWEEGRVKDGNI